ncbi:hypothetical protein [Nocardia tengchongensis]|uniref:hypothetical protein n=1 Tax=Nocardia tengchongensis TaxID=2055889 RepID=UPI003606E40B
MSDIAAADERAILDQLRRLQTAHHSGDQETAKALLDDLFTRYGQATIAEMRWRQANDQLAADVELFKVFGSAALRGDD